MDYEYAKEKDIKELYDLQLRAFESEAEMINSRNVPALMESYEENRADFINWTVLIKRDDSGCCKMQGERRSHRNRSCYGCAGTQEQGYSDRPDDSS